ncbi:MAG: hypothetical protein CMJ58_06700 [Planctomycetaceae bacterium]|nr:hypothetical protein [Planctomycetaceae bacterium]
MADERNATAAEMSAGAVRRSDAGAWWALPALLAVLIVAVAAIGWRQSPRDGDTSAAGTEQAPTPRPNGETVSLTVEFGNGASRDFAALPHRPEMTIADAMAAARNFRPGLTFVQQGEGAAAFLTAIDGVTSESAGGRYWQILVNGEPINDSFGAHRVAPGDRILWRYAAE